MTSKLVHRFNRDRLLPTSSAEWFSLFFFLFRFCSSVSGGQSKLLFECRKTTVGITRSKEFLGVYICNPAEIHYISQKMQSINCLFGGWHVEPHWNPWKDQSSKSKPTSTYISIKIPKKTPYFFTFSDDFDAFSHLFWCQNGAAFLREAPTGRWRWLAASCPCWRMAPCGEWGNPAAWRPETSGIAAIDLA